MIELKALLIPAIIANSTFWDSQSKDSGLVGDWDEPGGLQGGIDRGCETLAAKIVCPTEDYGEGERGGVFVVWWEFS